MTKATNVTSTRRGPETVAIEDLTHEERLDLLSELCKIEARRLSRVHDHQALRNRKARKATPELTDEVLRGLLVLRALGLTSPTRDRVPELEAALKYIRELGETT